MKKTRSFPSKHVVKRFDGSKRYGEQFLCACCKMRLTYGYTLSSGEVICSHCTKALKRLIDYGKSSINEQQARAIQVSQHQAGFFGVDWDETPPRDLSQLTPEERQAIDAQAEQDAEDIFG